MKDRLLILEGDATDRVQALETGSVQCVVTSPPYFGLRDYGTAKWEGGSDDACDHIERTKAEAHKGSTLGPKRDGLTIDNAAFKARERTYVGDCGKCGAKRTDAQIGLEKTPEEYVAKLVALFREVRRVLKDDGTLWLNLGDSYSGGGNYRGVDSMDTLTSKQASNRGARGLSQLCGTAGKETGCKPKDLVGIPWMVAFALRADGWYLRSDIIWSKPNPMPESVTDRPTKAHEYLFLLTKSGRYFYDAAAIQEPAIYFGLTGQGETGFKNAAEFNGKHGEAAKNGEQRRDKQRGHGRRHAGFNDRWDAMERTEQCGGMRNKRSVWTVATAPYSEAHFATFPPDLIKPCILAGSRAGDTVLDPFAGSGTTGMVAIELGRKAILIELNPAYITLIEQRTTDITPGLPFTFGEPLTTAGSSSQGVGVEREAQSESLGETLTPQGDVARVLRRLPTELNEGVAK